MSNFKLFSIIGSGIFGGLILMTFIQLEKAEYKMEALGFIATAAVVYFGLVWIIQKGLRKVFTAAVLALAVLAISAAMFHTILFSGTH
ncbi:hypothetical protein V1502_09095 [Bacillus sp. SCS-153A]|uniref:hypothetical protein n=1 Tax=Rossellomorea sedimentorum TaxID=3115294 RepID=UPI003905DF7A